MAGQALVIGGQWERRQSGVVSLAQEATGGIHGGSARSVNGGDYPYLSWLEEEEKGGRAGRAQKVEWAEYYAVKIKGNLDGLLGGLGQILERIRNLFFEFFVASLNGFKGYLNLNEGFWTFSQIETWKLVKDLDQINLNSRME
jgi:hypothetical protein